MLQKCLYKSTTSTKLRYILIPVSGFGCLDFTFTQRSSQFLKLNVVTEDHQMKWIIWDIRKTIFPFAVMSMLL